MIIGAHMLLYTPDADALRATLRDAFGFPHVDAGQGWLIFRLPPSELGVHPSEKPDQTDHVISFMCDDIQATCRDLRGKGVTIDGEPEDHGYGVVVYATLPGGVKVQIYEPRHPLAIERR